MEDNFHTLKLHVFSVKPTVQCISTKISVSSGNTKSYGEN